MSNSNRQTDSEWTQIVRELRAYRQAEAAVWDGIDWDAFSRYRAGRGSVQEAATFDRMLAAVPELRQMNEILDEIESLESFPVPAPVPFDMHRLTDSRDSLESIRRVQRQIHELTEATPEAARAFELDAPLFEAWEQIAARPLDERAGLLQQAVFQFDRLYGIAAGTVRERPVRASLPWFAALRARPQELVWDADSTVDQWSVRLSCPDAFLYWDGETAASRMPLPESWFDQIPARIDVLWTVERLEPAGDAECTAHVRGVFQLLSEEDLQLLRDGLRKAAKVKDPHSREISEIGYLLERQLFLEAEQRLTGLATDVQDATTRVLVHRGLASLYRAIQTELSGSRQLGTPEGLWALATAQTHLESAYQLMQLPFSFGNRQGVR